MVNELTQFVDEIKEQEELDVLSKIKDLLKRPKTKQQGIYALSQLCMAKFRFLTFQDVLYIYQEGVYSPDAEKYIASYVQRELALKNLISAHVISELFGYIKRLTFKSRFEINEPTDKICLDNGILSLKNLSVGLHTPETIFFNKLPVKFSSQADCPAIKKFLGEIVAPDDIPVLQEIAGYCLLKDYPIHKAFMFVGAGANGKSTFIRLLRSFLGNENTTSVPLQKLENNRFALSSLFGKLANVFADLPAKDLTETSIFKMLTGEDDVPAEKKFKDMFFFKNYAKMIFSANQIPRSPDNSDAFFRRMMILNFPKQFLNEEADVKLIDKLCTPEELSGFLNFAIIGLRRLLEAGQFSNSISIEVAREDYLRRSDSCAAFVMDCILSSPDEFIEKKVLYTSYCDYCRSFKAPILPEPTFHRRMQGEVRITEYRPLINGLRVQCWLGVKLNPVCVNHVNHVNLFSHLSSSKHFQKCQPELNIENNPDNPDMVDTDKPISDGERVLDPKSILGLFKNSSDLAFEELQAGSGLSEQELLANLRSLNSAGDVYEIRPGIWRRL